MLLLLRPRIYKVHRDTRLCKYEVVYRILASSSTDCKCLLTCGTHQDGTANRLPRAWNLVEKEFFQVPTY